MIYGSLGEGTKIQTFGKADFISIYLLIVGST